MGTLWALFLIWVVVTLYLGFVLNLGLSYIFHNPLVALEAKNLLHHFMLEDKYTNILGQKCDLERALKVCGRGCLADLQAKMGDLIPLEGQIANCFASHDCDHLILAATVVWLWLCCSNLFRFPLFVERSKT